MTEGGRWIFLHGIGNGPAVFDDLIDRMPTDSAIAVPLPAAVGSETSATLVARLIDRIAEVESPPWRLLGHSLGGVVAGIVARKAVDSVSCLVLLNAPMPSVEAALLSGSSVVLSKRTRRALRQIETLAILSSWGVVKLPPALRKLEISIARTAVRPFLGKDSHIPDDHLYRLLVDSRTPDARGHLRVARQPRSEGRTPFVACPVEIVLGSQDPLIDETEDALILRQYPKARIHRLKGVGHFAQIEDVEAVAAILEEVKW